MGMLRGTGFPSPGVFGIPTKKQTRQDYIFVLTKGSKTADTVKTALFG